MKQNFLGNAIKSLSGDCAYDTDGETILNWKSPDVSQPSQADIDAKIVELEAEWTAQEYSRNRQAEYPSINELIVALWENVVEERAASVIELESLRQAVKARYPK